MVLTTCRIVCVNNDKKSLFKCFDLPLALIYKESFKQPIFGSNYIGGYCKPLLNTLPGDTEFYIYLTEGGCGTLVPAFMNILNNVRKNNNKGPDSKFLNSVANGVFAKSAYIDPNDPSTIYLEQPQQFSNESNSKGSSSIVQNKGGTVVGGSNLEENSNNFPSLNEIVSENPSNTNSNFSSTNNINNNTNTSYSSYNNNTNTNSNNNFSNFNNQQVIYSSNNNGSFNNNSNVNQQYQQQFQGSSLVNNMSNNTNYINTNNNIIQNNQFTNINSSNQSHENEYPSINDLQTNNPNTANIINEEHNNQNQNNPKYFYFFGPELKKNN